MPVSANIAIQTFRSRQRSLAQGPVVPRLWQVMRIEWQRRLDRTVAQSVRKLDHDGVIADYRMACRGR
jgi:hypothetical protein